MRSVLSPFAACIDRNNRNRLALILIRLPLSAVFGNVHHVPAPPHLFTSRLLRLTSVPQQRKDRHLHLVFSRTPPSFDGLLCSLCLCLLPRWSSFGLRTLCPVAATMTERYIPEHRRTNFKAKNAFKPDELRRRREEQQVEIRKAKREEALAKKRNIGPSLGASLGAAPDSDDEGLNIESQVCGITCFYTNTSAIPARV